MRSSSLDRRIRKEATLLVRDARTALSLKKGLKGRAGELEPVTDEVEQGLKDRDMARVRKHLPILDMLVDELVKRPPKSTTRDYVESIGAAILIALALRAFVIEAFKIPSSSMYPTLEIGDHIFVNKFIYGVRIPWTKIKLFELREPHRGEVIVFIYPCNPDRDYIKRVVALAGDTVEVRCNVLYVNGQAVPNKLLEGPTCHYDDWEERSNTWSKKDCSLYEETVNGHSYVTYQDAARPARDQYIAATGHLPQDSIVGGNHDFPQRGQMPPSCATNGEEPPPDGPVDQVLGKIVSTKPESEAKLCEPQMHYVVPPGHVFAMGDNRSNSNDSRYWGSVPLENIKGKALFIWLSYSTWGPTDWSGIRWPRIGEFVR